MRSKSLPALISAAERRIVTELHFQVAVLRLQEDVVVFYHVFPLVRMRPLLWLGRDGCAILLVGLFRFRFRAVVVFGLGGGFRIVGVLQCVGLEVTVPGTSAGAERKRAEFAVELQLLDRHPRSVGICYPRLHQRRRRDMPAVKVVHGFRGEPQIANHDMGCSLSYDGI